MRTLDCGRPAHAANFSHIFFEGLAGGFTFRGGIARHTSIASACLSFLSHKDSINCDVIHPSIQTTQTYVTLSWFVFTTQPLYAAGLC